MKPWKTLATDGKFSLRQREREYMVLHEGKILMTSRQHGSEKDLVRIGCARVSVEQCDLAEYLAGLDQVEHRILSLG